LLVSDHPLAVERLRWAERYRGVVPRSLRLCRLCHRAVEDPLHALFACTGATGLVTLRAAFFQRVDAERPELRRRARDPEGLLCALLLQRDMTAMLAKLAANVLDVFERVPMWIHPDAMAAT
ncbi:hypothetical protein OBBRIDRAFT_731429, partial [Obba rivulosa]